MNGIREIYEIISKYSRKSKLLKKIVRNLSYLQMAIEAKLDDETFAQKQYKRYNNAELNIHEPKTYNEKLWWLKFHYRNPYNPHSFPE